MSRRRVKGGTADEVFQVQCFLWAKGDSNVADLDLFNFQYVLDAQEHITH